MTSDLRRQLQATLGSAYLIERELGGGGMSRVFVAEDQRLGRRVVVKVLHPELAATVSAARFEREIRLAARLQHPHVVPVLTAGEVGGLPYYTMPFVEGESLRARLAREGALPVADALRLLRELAYALVHAHGHGVVHRDLKPENVLLSGGHAMVADFGIAKALASSVPTVAGLDASTTPVTIGAVVGTPAYMAPEQAAGDPTVDHRADLYALGVIAYELLTGSHPFSARSPQDLLAAHLTQTPAPLLERRPEVPPALASLVAHCLQKRRAERVQSAIELLGALDELAGGNTMVTPTRASGWTTTPFGAMLTGGGARPRRTRVAILAGAAALAITAAFVVRGRAGAADDVPAAPDGLVVADFQDRVGDSSLVRTVAEALRIDLARSPRLALPSSQQVREALVAMRADTAPALSSELAVSMSRRLGGKAVLDGSVSAAGRGFVLTARLVAVDDGRTVTTFRETADDSSDVVGAIDRLSRAVRREVGESIRSLQASPRLPMVTTGSLPALTAYTKSVEAGNVSDWLRVADFAREATVLDPEFGEAYRRIAAALDNLGIQRDEAVRAATRAYELRERLQPFERGLAEASYYSTVLGDHRRAGERYELLAAEFPGARSASARNNLANAYANLGEWERALPIARALVDSEPRSVRFRSNYIGYLTASGRLGAADSAIRAFALEFPGQPNVVRRATGLAKAQRDYAKTAMLADSALRADASMSATGRVYLGNVLRGAAAALGQLERRAAADAELIRHYERLGSAPEQLTVAVEFARLEASVGFLDRSRLHLDSAVARYPLTAMRPLDRPYAALAAAWATAGRADRATALLREWERAVPEVSRGIDAVPILRARILTELAVGNAAGAERLARGGSFGPCSACADLYLARAFEARGLADSTLTAYERYLTGRAGRDLIDDTELARAYRRLGELYEARGDTRRAVQRYGDFVELWRQADPPLLPAVREVRQRIARLQARPG